MEVGDVPRVTNYPGAIKNKNKIRGKKKINFELRHISRLKMCT
jgi:hypothetical protein